MNYILYVSNSTCTYHFPHRSGKTFVAAEFVLQGLNKLREGEEAWTKGRNGAAALFLVPTCDLVTQQKRALKAWVGDFSVAEYFGGKAIPKTKFDVLVSTPQAFLVRHSGNMYSIF